jgi:hypothetical protein
VRGLLVHVLVVFSQFLGGFEDGLCDCYCSIVADCICFFRRCNWFSVCYGDRAFILIGPSHMLFICGGKFLRGVCDYD